MVRLARLANGDESRDVAGVKVLAREASGLTLQACVKLSDTLLARIKSGVVVLGGTSDGKVSLIVRTSDDLTEPGSCWPGRSKSFPLRSSVAKAAARQTWRKASGTQPEKLGDALEQSYAVIERSAECVCVGKPHRLQRTRRHRN